MQQTQHGNRLRAYNLQHRMLSLTTALDIGYMTQQHHHKMLNNNRQNVTDQIATHMMLQPLQHRLHQHRIADQVVERLQAELQRH
jgi:hypothetical protein